MEKTYKFLLMLSLSTIPKAGFKDMHVALLYVVTKRWYSDTLSCDIVTAFPNLMYFIFVRKCLPF